MKNFNYFILLKLLIIFSLLSCSEDSVKSTDDNPFREVKIGEQVWMAKDLDVVTYSNGDTIPQITDWKEWSETETGAWCYYANDIENNRIHGKLYNWYAVNDPRGLAPAGWHVPTDEEWHILEQYLGMVAADLNSYNFRGRQQCVGGSLKATGIYEEFTGFWKSPNKMATDSVGFSAQPGGKRDPGGEFNQRNLKGYWWTSSNISHGSLCRELLYSARSIARSPRPVNCGFSVRCVKD